MTKLQETVLEERKRREKESVKNVGIHVPGVWASRRKRNIQKCVDIFRNRQI